MGLMGLMGLNGLEGLEGLMGLMGLMDSRTRIPWNFGQAFEFLGALTRRVGAPKD